MRNDLISAQTELAQTIECLANQDGTFETPIPELHFFRASQVSEPVYSVYQPSLCIIAQGAKEVMLGEEKYRYDPSSYLTASVHLPITGLITQATPEMPYLSLQLELDMNLILEVFHATGHTAENRRRAGGRGLMISQMDHLLYDAVLRLVHLLEEPKGIPVLAPYIIREIIYRILQKDRHTVLQQIMLVGSQTQRVAQVIERLNRDFATTLRVDELAEQVHMSPSSLYTHFKDVTGMSPIKYQKQIRLQEARRLLMTDQLDAADAGFRVGYESPSHFSREYARMFGLPPASDIRRMRQQV